MKFLKVKDITYEVDSSDYNVLERDTKGNPIKFRRSKCTVRFIFEDNEGNEYCWVKKNKELTRAIELIAKGEENKYKVYKKPIPEKEWFEFPSGKSKRQKVLPLCCNIIYYITNR